MNLLEKEVTSPADDPNWIVPYHNAAVENIVDGMVYYFSTAMRNQLVREKAGKSKNSSSTVLTQIDLDYARAVILTTKLLTVMTFFRFILFDCFSICSFID
jgi:hypothetical protein